MKPIKNIFLLFCILFLMSAFISDHFTLDKSISQKGTSITSDNLGNIYIVLNDQLFKYDMSGTFLKSYSNKTLGNITAIDVSDPLKTLVFYKDFSKVVFLDNTLSIKKDAISLADKGFDQAVLACTSYESGFWIFDQPSSKLIRFDNNLQQTNQSESLSQLTGKEIHPAHLAEYNNFIYLSDTANGVLIFDRYGTYFKTILITGIISFQIQDDYLLYLKAHRFISYNMKSFSETTIDVPIPEPMAIRVMQNKLIILYNEGVSIYSSDKKIGE
jgi:hypothetical protein